MSADGIPKAELHVHLEGTAPPALIRDLAGRNGLTRKEIVRLNKADGAGYDRYIADLEKVVPLLPPDFFIRIAGSTPGGLSSASPNVQFVGRVPDAVDFVRGAAVIPLISTAGSGVQLKTIETFELGLPSVATSRSLRGIDHRPQNCRVTDDPREFAALLVEVRQSIRDVDGRDFYTRQRQALDSRIRRGLQAIGHTRLEEVA